MMVALKRGVFFFATWSALLACAQPAVYMTPLQTAGLEDAANNGQWSTVRHNLHGLWFNNAGNSLEETRDTILNLGKRSYPVLVPVSYEYSSPLTYQYPAWTKYEQINEMLGGAKVLKPSAYLFDSIKVANGEYDLQEAIAAIRAMRADARFAGVPNGVTFSPRHGLDMQSKAGNDTYFARTKALIDEVNGVVAIESAPARMKLPNAQTGFVAIYKYAKSRNLEFVWLMNRGVGTDNDHFIGEISGALKRLASEDCYPDVIAVSNQGSMKEELLPALPEVDSAGKAVDSITGALYWLLDRYDWLSVPVACDQSIEANIKGRTRVELAAAGGALTYKILGAPLHGTLAGFDEVAGTANYMAHPGYAGVDSFSFCAMAGNLSSTGLVYITVRDSAVELRLQTGSVADVLLDGYKDYASTNLEKATEKGEFIYDISDAGIGGEAVVLKLAVVSGSGEKVRLGGFHGIAVAGGEKPAWWEVGDELVISAALLDSGFNDVSSSYDVDLTGVAMRWKGARGVMAAFNGETVATTQTDVVIEEFPLASGQMNESVVTATRPGKASMSQLAGLIYKIRVR